jgi:hypothetical protein
MTIPSKQIQIQNTAEESPGNPQLRDCAISYRLKWGPLPPNEVGSIAQYVRNMKVNNGLDISAT